jgi:hypothetical protein
MYASTYSSEEMGFLSVRAFLFTVISSQEYASSVIHGNKNHKKRYLTYWWNEHIVFILCFWFTSRIFQ